MGNICAHETTIEDTDSQKDNDYGASIVVSHRAPGNQNTQAAAKTSKTTKRKIAKKIKKSTCNNEAVVNQQRQQEVTTTNRQLVSGPKELELESLMSSAKNLRSPGRF